MFSVYTQKTPNASQNALVDENLIFGFKKVPDFLPERVSDPLAGWLLTCIISRINRFENVLDMTVAQLAALSGISERSVMRKTKILESAGLIVVTRMKIGAKNAINRYALRGDLMAVVCGAGAVSVSECHRDEASFGDTVAHLYRDNDITEHEMNDDIDILREGKNPSTDDAEGATYAEERLRAFGVRGVNVKRMADVLGDGLVDEAIVTAQSMARRNPAGYLVRMVEEGWQPEASEGAFVGQSWADFASTCTDDVTQDADFVADEAPSLADLLSESADIVEDDFTADDDVRDEHAILWDFAYYQLQLQMNAQAFSHLRGADYLGMIDGVMRVRCARPIDAELLQTRYYRVIEKIVSDVVGYVVPIEFEAPQISTVNPFKKVGV